MAETMTFAEMKKRVTEHLATAINFRGEFEVRLARTSNVGWFVILKCSDGPLVSMNLDFQGEITDFQILNG